MRNYSIGFICPSTSWGGLEMNVCRLAVWLKKRGWNIILYGIPNSPLHVNTKKNLIEFRALTSTSKINDLFLFVRLAKLTRSDNVRILVLHTNRNFLLAVLAKIISRNFFKLIYYQHMHVGKTKKDFFHTWEYRQLDCWVTSLPTLERILTEKINISSNKVIIIPYGIELNKFTTSKPNKNISRDKLNLPRDVIIAGVIGRLDPKKSQHILIEACARVHQAGYPLHLLIVGDKSLNEQTGYTEYLYELTARYNLQDFVHFKPHLNEVEHAYAAMDLFVLTSMSETYGMVTIEAMASGLPVIGTNEGGTRDIIDDNVNGILVKPLDAEELLKAIIKIITDQKTSQKLASQAKEDAIKKYSHSRQCERLESLFDSLTNK